MTDDVSPERVGAYGLQLRASGRHAEVLARASRWLLPLEPSWPRWELRAAPLGEPAGSRSSGVEGPETEPSSLDGPDEPDGLDGPDSPDRPDSFVGPDRAVLYTKPAGRLEIDRAARRTTVVRHAPMTPDELVHPHLAPTACIAGHWLGRTSFHAGAFAVNGRAWGVMGARQMGKSSLLMSLHASGLPVVSDDLVVVEEGRVFSGPRCIDLRRSAADRFESGRALGRVGGRERWRVDLPDIAPELPLAGWVLLGWSDGVVVEPIEGSYRLAVLATHRALLARGTAHPAFLDLATLPMLLFSRPRDWGRAEQGFERLLEPLSEMSSR
jgi:hypothetical protein